MLPDYLLKQGKKKKVEKPEKGHAKCQSCGWYGNKHFMTKIKGVKGWLCGRCTAY